MVNKLLIIVTRFRNPKLVLLSSLVLTVFLVSLRLIHLEADTPIEFAPEVAIYVDEGYKTLAAKNLVLEGSTHWNPQDEYPGWLKDSALTQLSYYAAFRLYDVNLTAARLAAVAIYALFLVGFVVTFGSRYHPVLLYGGLLLLGLQHTLFFFSRIALHEVFIVAILYLSLFSIQIFANSRLPAGLLILSLGGFVSIFGVKQSAAIYVFLAFAGMLLAYLIDTRLLFQGRVAAAIVVFSTLSIGLVYVVKVGLVPTHPGSPWSFLANLKSFDFFPISAIVQRIAAPSLVLSDPSLVLLGMAAWVGATRHSPAYYARTMYPAGLLGLVLAGPIILALFPGNPLRLALPTAPAYILLFVEWLHVRSQESPPQQSFHWLSYLRVPALALFLFVTLLSSYNLSFRDAYSRWNPPDLQSVALGLLISASLAWFISKRWQESPWPRLATVSVVLLVAWFFANSAFHLFNFVRAPRFQTVTIAKSFRAFIPQQAAVAGDWAPLFALVSGHRTLYVHLATNPPDRILDIRPDYFLLSDIEDSRKYLRQLQGTAGVRVNGPLFRNYYFDTEVTLYRLSYDSVEQPVSGYAR